MAHPQIPSASKGAPEGDEDLRFLAGIVAILAAERKSQGITLRDLGADTGYNPGYYSRAERGLTEPGIVSLCRWCGALGLDFVAVAQQAKDSPRDP